MDKNGTPEFSMPESYGVPEAARILRLNPMTVRRRIRAGILRAFLLPGSDRYLIRKADLLEYLSAAGLEPAEVSAIPAVVAEESANES